MNPYGNKEEVATSDINNLIRKRFSDSRRYALAREVSNQTGGGRRRLDWLVAYCYQSDGWALEGIEVKMTKSDFRKEFENTDKHNIFYPSLDYYSIAAPKSVIDMELVPRKWGVYEVTRQKTDNVSDEIIPVLTCRRKPLMLHDEKLTTVDRAFAISAMRALYNQSPDKKRLDAEYQRGVEEGKKIAMLHRQSDNDRQHFEWLERENKRLKESIEAYEELKGMRWYEQRHFGEVVRAMGKINLKQLSYATESFEEVMEPVKQLASFIKANEN